MDETRSVQLAALDRQIASVESEMNRLKGMLRGLRRGRKLLAQGEPQCSQSSNTAASGEASDA
jgi:hypothetical protein